MPQAEYQRRLLDRAHPPHRWENQAAARYRLKQLDMKEVRRAIDEATAAGHLESAVMSPVEAIEKRKLLENGHVPQAAVVAFAKEVLPGGIDGYSQNSHEFCYAACAAVASALSTLNCRVELMITVL